MTSTWGERGQLAQKQIIILINCEIVMTTRAEGEGEHNPKCGHHLWIVLCQDFQVDQ